MTNQNPDPLEQKITGLEPGGGVPPGETPPAEGQTSMTQGHEEGGPKAWVPWLWLSVILGGTLLAIVFFLAYAGILAFG
ncbi:hypothetical protein NCCP1664_17410 [Zafaria cholistanensis]|uniref:Uncharacterized protein n=1 Tax=Zafaria cholistanensis TaxID=1682741 RepID=A0A5A7NR67_9MICC|nr:DUF6480 family protein [Zafaria cholistanensis]GER23245.1 hypothetical protein NCCP1664_17410 [Zafaria cholistanensis]